MRLPSFMHVGPPRTGTTWLHEVLAGHVGLPTVKETRFFETEFRGEILYGRGLEWYSRYFAEYPARMVLGEFAPSYFSNAVARDRIKQDIPDCKIICTFRDPAARFYSAYRLERALRHPVHGSFDEYWQFLVSCGMDLCSYATQLRRWQKAFGKDRVLILFYDDLKADPQNYLSRVCEFIGIPAVSVEGSKVGAKPVFQEWTAAQPNPAARAVVSSIYWLSRHGGESILRVGMNTQWRSAIRRAFVTDFEPLSQTSADEVRHMMLAETEELEQLTGRDLSKWKPGAPPEGPKSAARATLGRA